MLKELNSRVRRCGALCETLVAVAAIGGFWCEQRHHSLWAMALQRLIDVRAPRELRVALLGDYTRWLEFWRYPATLLFYSLGIGAVAHRRFHLLGGLLSLAAGVDGEPCVADVLSPRKLSTKDVLQQLEGMSGHAFALNEWIFQELREPFRSILPSDLEYKRVSAELETLLMLGRTRKRSPIDAELTTYLIDLSDRTDIRLVLGKIRRSIAEEGASSPYVASRIFGSTLTECRTQITALSKYGHWRLMIPP